MVRMIVPALAGIAFLAVASGAGAETSRPMSAASQAGQSLDPSPHLPVRLDPGDLALFLGFDSFRRHVIDSAMAASGNDPAFVAAATQILDGSPVPITNEEALVGRWRCRSAQFFAGGDTGISGVYAYPYFRCAITRKGGRLFFAKTSGSQRESGFLYRADATRYAFLGGSSVNDEPQRAYGDAHDSNVIGWFSRMGDKRLVLQMPTKDGKLEILELVR